MVNETILGYRECFGCSTLPLILISSFDKFDIFDLICAIRPLSVFDLVDDEEVDDSDLVDDEDVDESDLVADKGVDGVLVDNSRDSLVSNNIDESVLDTVNGFEEVCDADCTTICFSDVSCVYFLSFSFSFTFSIIFFIFSSSSFSLMLSVFFTHCIL